MGQSALSDQQVGGILNVIRLALSHEKMAENADSKPLP